MLHGGCLKKLVIISCKFPTVSLISLRSCDIFPSFSSQLHCKNRCTLNSHQHYILYSVLHWQSGLASVSLFFSIQSSSLSFPKIVITYCEDVVMKCNCCITRILSTTFSIGDSPSLFNLSSTVCLSSISGKAEIQSFHNVRIRIICQL